MPAKTSDIDDAASRIARSIEGESKANMPQPVTLNVTDGTPQKTAGWVWASRGDHQVQVIASMGIGDLSAATPTTPITIWAYPPNPGEPNQPYFGICITYDSVSGSRAPVIRATQYLDNTGSPIASGTVTSVALSMPGIFSVSGSPIIASGTFSVSLATQSANTVFAGPTSGGAATPTFRSLVAGDIPSLSATYANVALSNLSGATSDMLAQYLLLAGRASGQTAYGGAAASENLTLDSTAHATKGNVLIGGSTLRIDEALATIGVKGAAITAQAQTIYTGADANVGLQIRQNSATQSGLLQSWTSSAGGFLMGVGPAGTLRIGTNANPFDEAINATRTWTVTSGTNVGFRAVGTVNPSASSSGGYYGFLGGVTIAAGQAQNITGSLIGLFPSIDIDGSGTVNVAKLTQFQTIVRGSKIITGGYGSYNLLSLTGTGSVVTFSHVYIENISNTGTGTVTNYRGIYIADIAAGTSTNYAILTNAGNVYFNNGGDPSSDFRWSSDTLANALFGDASADSIGINTSTPSALTYLDVVGTAKSSRPAPGMTTAQRDALATPPDGALVYNTDSHRLTGYYNDAWVEFDDIIGWVA